MDKYRPANKDGTKLQQAQYWLEKACTFSAERQNLAEQSFNLALKMEAEHHAST